MLLSFFSDALFVRSPARAAVREYCQMAMDPLPELFTGAVQGHSCVVGRGCEQAAHLFSGKTCWRGLDSDAMQLAHFSLVSVMTHCWHRLVLPFEMWPMRLGALADDSDDMATQRATVAAEFERAPTCCMDRFFSQRLQSLMKAIS